VYTGKGTVVYHAANLGYVFLDSAKKEGEMRVAETLADRSRAVPERALAWIRWMGISQDPGRADGESHCLKRILELYVMCAAAVRDDGWREICCLVPWIGGMRKTNLKLSREFASALSTDSVSAFELALTLGMGKLTRHVLRTLIDADNEGRLLEHILEKHPEAFKLMTPREILLHACVACPSDEKAVRIVRALVRREPDLCRMVDRNGFTPLVYTLFAQRVPLFDFRKRCGNIPRHPYLESVLIENGCSPHAKDRFGLSWSDLTTLPQAFPRA